MQLISPSILSADFGNLKSEIEKLNQSQADYVHIDVMDGVFVPNISFGFPILESIKGYNKLPLDVHLMIVNPTQYVERLVKIGAKIITVHYEACNHLHRAVQLIKSFGIKAGVSLNPHTPVSLLENVLPELDLVLLMSVNPGFGGQKFIEQTYKKVKQLRKMIDDGEYDVMIEVDGGVNLENAKALYDAGVDVLVAGNAVFNTPDIVATIEKFKHV